MHQFLLKFSLKFHAKVTNFFFKTKKHKILAAFDIYRLPPKSSRLFSKRGTLYE